MKNFILLALMSLSITVSFGQSNANQTSSSFKIGFVKYEITDTANIDSETAEFMTEMMKSSLEKDIVFNKTRMAELFIDEDGEAEINNMYDFETGFSYEFLDNEDGKFMTKMNIKEATGKMELSAEDSIQMASLIRLDESKEGTKVIHGFTCQRVIISSPEDPKQEFFTAYCAEDIPYITNAMGPFGQFVKGMPLESTMNMEGLKIYLGVLEYQKMSNLGDHLNINLSEYKEITDEEFHEKKSGF